MEQERQHEQREAPGPQGIGSIFDSGRRAGGNVTVMHGPYAERLPVGSRTIAEIRSDFATRLDLDENAVAILDGHEVDDQTVVHEGQVLLFTRRAGEKGACAA